MLRTEFPNGQVAVIKAIEMLLPLTCLGVVCGSCHNDLAGIEFAAGGEVATSRNYPTNQARADLNRTGCGVRLHSANTPKMGQNSYSHNSSKKTTTIRHETTNSQERFCLAYPGRPLIRYPKYKLLTEKDGVKTRCEFPI